MKWARYRGESVWRDGIPGLHRVLRQAKIGSAIGSMKEASNEMRNVNDVMWWPWGPDQVQTPSAYTKIWWIPPWYTKYETSDPHQNIQNTKLQEPSQCTNTRLSVSPHNIYYWMHMLKERLQIKNCSSNSPGRMSWESMYENLVNPSMKKYMKEPT